jgi:ribA/ribD-fused uncharacterized protein
MRRLRRTVDQRRVDEPVPAVIPEFRGRWMYLSNFYPAPVEYQGITYPTVEHAFQAAKTKDKGLRKEIAALRLPGDAKRRGKTLTLRKDWDKVKVDIMRELLSIKFTSDPRLADILLSTGTAELQEGNWWGDTFWGMYQGKGQNTLGKLLMELREYLR